MADAQRTSKTAALKERSANGLAEAQRREDTRRVTAINDELTAKAHRRTQQDAQARAASTTPPYAGY